MMGCAFRLEKNYTVIGTSGERPTIHILMPENNLIFDNLGPIFYEAIAQRFLASGFYLSNNAADALTLQISFDQQRNLYKYLSPDMVTHGNRIDIAVTYALLAKDGTKIVQKKLHSPTSILRARNPVDDSAIVDYEFRRLAHRIASMIETTLRMYTTT